MVTTRQFKKNCEMWLISASIVMLAIVFFASVAFTSPMAKLAFMLGGSALTIINTCYFIKKAVDDRNKELLADSTLMLNDLSNLDQNINKTV